MPSTTILEEIEAEKTAQQRLRHLSSVSSLPSADLAFIDGFWERHLADMPGRDGYPEGCLLLLDDVRAVLSGSVGDGPSAPSSSSRRSTLQLHRDLRQGSLPHR